MAATNATVERFYRWNAPIYDLTRWVILRGRRAAVEALRLRPGGRVLEVGCGTGLNFARLHDRVGEEGSIIGVDLSQAMLARARRRRRPSVHLIRADAARLPLRGRFDAVLMVYSLTMIPDWRSALAQACDRLEPGGTIVVLDFARPEDGFAPLRAAFDRYLALNHVETDRDLIGALRACVSDVEGLRVRPGYVTLLRGTM